MSGSEAPLPSDSCRYFIDALNIAYWCGRPPSLRVPITLMSHLIQQGHPTRLYFDASARYQLAHEGDLYAALMQQSEHCIEVPSGRSADELMLKHARASGACILSRDQYRDHRRRYRKLIDDPNRLISGWVHADRLHLPTLNLNLPLPDSSPSAWRMLQSHLAAS